MARIRSIHPGIFTDEGFVALSSDAQVLLFGLWTEADDQGIFEWKPVTLRMRLRPAKDGNIEAFLSELVQVNAVTRFEVGGRQYGAIRNFRRFQRPKKPNAIHHMTDEIRTYVGLTASSSELDDDEDGQSTELLPQMEDEGGRMKGEDGGNTSAAASPAPPADDSPEFIRIPTNRFDTTGEEVPVSEKFVEQFQQLYPAVDVKGELRKMRGWSISNRDQRKTRKGMNRFINQWLGRQQDRGQSNSGGRNAADRTPATRGASGAHQRHLEGLALLVDEADGQSKGVPERGQLALAAGEDGEFRRRAG